MADVRIDTPTQRDYAHVALHMRDDDRREVWAAMHHTPLQALSRAVRLSSPVWAAYVDGEPIAVWGVMPKAVLGHTGVPWLLGTSRLEDYPLVVLRASVDAVPRMHAVYPVLRNMIDARNRLALRWLRWLKFVIEPATPYGPDGVAFHPFWRTVNV